MTGKGWTATVGVGSLGEMYGIAISGAIDRENLERLVMLKHGPAGVATFLATFDKAKRDKKEEMIEQLLIDLLPRLHPALGRGVD